MLRAIAHRSGSCFLRCFKKVAPPSRHSEGLWADLKNTLSCLKGRFFTSAHESRCSQEGAKYLCGGKGYLTDGHGHLPEGKPFRNISEYMGNLI